MGDVRVRRLEAADGPVFIGGEGAFREYLEDQEAGRRSVYVAELEGDFAGYVTILWTAADPAFRKHDVPEISDLRVRRELRGRGVATALLDRAEAEAAARNDRLGLNVGLHSGYGSAQRIYVRRGYLPDGQGAVVEGETVPEGATITLDDDPIVTLRMTKELTGEGARWISAPPEEASDASVVPGGRVGGPISWRMHLPVPLEQTYAALDSDQGRASFWAESAREDDGHIDFRFSNGYRYRSEILEKTPPTVFELTYFDGRVRFELADDGDGGTDLRVTHHGVEPEDWHEVHAGWLNVLFPMKAYLAHGVDLRNHDPGRSWSQGYADG